MSDSLVDVAVRAIGYTAFYVHRSLKRQNDLNDVVTHVPELPPSSIYCPHINFYQKWTWVGDPERQIINHASKDDSVQYLTDHCNEARFCLLYINNSVYFKRKCGIHSYLFQLFINYREAKLK